MTAHAKLVVLALVACVAGCSVVTALTDLDSRYARDAADGSVSSDAAAVDAALGQDGSATDSGDVDARTDGGVSPCATGTHTLCDDFDTAAALGAAPTWTASLLAQEGATISLATDLPFSAPRALSAAFPADAGGNPAASLSRGFVGPIGALDCSFMLRPETLDAKGLVQLLSITLPPPPASAYAPAYLELRLVDEHTDLRVGAPFADGGPGFYVQRDLGPPLVGQWSSVRIRFSALTTAPRLEIWLGGSLAADEPLTLGPVARATLELGVVTAIAGTRDWRVLFDDVVCDATPP